MRLSNAYSLAVLVTEGQFSNVYCARNLGLVSHDQIYRLLLKNEFNAIADWAELPPGGEIIIDDTVLAKPYSRTLEGVGYLYDSAEKKSVRGIGLLLMLYVARGKIYVLDVVLFGKGGETKNEMARELLKEAHESGLQPKRVLFDTWYGCFETQNLLESWHWVYVSRVRSNRLLNGQNLYKHDFKGVKSIRGQLKQVNHEVQIVKDGERYLMTNAKATTTSSKLHHHYGKRWVIEIVFRTLKSFLHLEKCSSRSMENQLAHVLACLEAFLFLQSIRKGRSLEQARIQFITDFRQAQARGELSTLLAA
jgi:hypothetical protein